MITPNQGSTGGGTTVTITGSELGGATAVHFGSETAVITANTDTSVTVVLPAGQGVVEVTVTTEAGKSRPVYFYYVPPPVIQALEPASGPVAGGSTLSITGRGLATATSVSFGGTDAVPTVQADGSLTVVTPAGSAGEVGVAVTAVGGTADDASYHYVAAPDVTGFSPLNGPLTGGNTVTLKGTGLLTTTEVTFGGTPAAFAALSDTVVAAVAPAHALGTVSLVVTTTGGSDTAPGTYLYLL